MTTYGYVLSGTLEIALPPAVVSKAGGKTLFKVDLLEELEISNYKTTVISLDADGQEAVAFDDVVEADSVFLYVRSLESGNILVRLTHADGTLQAIPFSSMFFLTSSTSPITAMTLERSAGVAAEILVVLCALT